MAADGKTFERVWAGFMEKYKEGMIKLSKEEKITNMAANRVLDRVIGVWGDENHECGRWLILYHDKYQHKGKRIYDILEMLTLSPHAEPKGMDKTIRRALPLIISLAVCILVWIIGGWIAGIISFVIAMMITGSVVHTINDTIKAKKDKDLIAHYMAELERCKEKILKIIE